MTGRPLVDALEGLADVDLDELDGTLLAHRPLPLDGTAPRPLPSREAGRTGRQEDRR